MTITTYDDEGNRVSALPVMALGLSGCACKELWHGTEVEEVHTTEEVQSFPAIPPATKSDHTAEEKADIEACQQPDVGGTNNATHEPHVEKTDVFVDVKAEDMNSDTQEDLVSTEADASPCKSLSLSSKDGSPRKSISSSSSRISYEEKDTLEETQSLAAFLWRVVVIEFSCQCFLSCVSAIPLGLAIMILAKMFKPENDVGGTTWNAHMQYVPWNKGHPGSYGNVGSLCVAYMIGMLVIMVLRNYVVDAFMYGWDHFRKLHTCWLNVFDVCVFIMYSTLNLRAIYNSSREDGPHALYLFGTMSPTPFTMTLMMVMYIVHGYFSKKIRGDWHHWSTNACTLAFCFVWLFEVLYLLPLENTNIVFIYRMTLQPLIYHILLGTPYRYIAKSLGGEYPDDNFPFIVFGVIVQTWSRLVLQFKMRTKAAFIILSITDCIYGSFMLRFGPDVDKVMMKFFAKCLPKFAPPTPRYAQIVRMMVFQCSTCADFQLLSGAAIMNWAFYDSRHLFFPAHPLCKEYDLGSLAIKVVTSLSSMITQDVLVTFLFWRLKLPVSRAFWMMFHNPLVWFVLSVWGLCIGFIGIYISTASPGKNGQCADFNDGCSCIGLQHLGELCGCCDPLVRANSTLEICKDF